MIISLVVAMDEGRVIGIDNRLPWRLPADLQHFRRVTTADAGELHHPPAARGATLLDHELAVAYEQAGSGREAIFEVAHRDDVHLTAQTVRSTDASNLEEDRVVCHVTGVRRYSATSTVTRTPSVAPAARPT